MSLNVSTPSVKSPVLYSLFDANGLNPEKKILKQKISLNEKAMNSEASSRLSIDRMIDRIIIIIIHHS